MTTDTDIIGGFPIAQPHCLGCGKELLLENAWMTDGCPCNHVLGVNNQNETRWRLLIQLQQRTHSECEQLADKWRQRAGYLQQQEAGSVAINSLADQYSAGKREVLMEAAAEIDRLQRKETP